MRKKNKKRILRLDPYLAPYETDIELRIENYKKKKKELLKKGECLSDFANGYKYFGFHKTDNGWTYREWAPAADRMYLTGDFCAWDIIACPMHKKDNGVFEIFLDAPLLRYGQKVQTVVEYRGKLLRRIPLYATRVVEDSKTHLWCAELEDTMGEYPWTDTDFVPEKTPYIYECHIGMSGEQGRVSTYFEFTEKVLPRIKKAGYNTIQIMAIMEHPYYASFGYQVSNFFAASSRYGKSDDLKALVDRAHNMGIAVLLDIVHSHASKNTTEGICAFDGTEVQFFHEGARGEHGAWGTKLFNYGKNEVIHFLLSNLKYWMETFHFDGFRFDGITSMIYRDHGLGRAFTDYSMYFSPNTDTDALMYLQLANELVHTLNPRAITVAEDMSGMPGMCLPIRDGGVGFDYRLSMGAPDMWIRLLKEKGEAEWDMWGIWHELTQRRPHEKNIGYAESHDQALVGDKTIMFRLCDAEMYTHMSRFTPSRIIDRGIALHKLIRLISASLAGEGYLNFMGNEFGHPEWIDFPREGNGWSYHYCRRQWSLVDDGNLRYRELGDFDAAMIRLLKDNSTLTKKIKNRWVSQNDKVLIYSRGELLFAVNMHPTSSFEGYFIPCDKGEYSIVLSLDDVKYGGYARVSHEYTYKTVPTSNKKCGFFCYLPSHTALVFKKQKTR